MQLDQHVQLTVRGPTIARSAVSIGKQMQLRQWPRTAFGHRERKPNGVNEIIIAKIRRWTCTILGMPAVVPAAGCTRLEGQNPVTIGILGGEPRCKRVNVRERVILSVENPGPFVKVNMRANGEGGVGERKLVPAGVKRSVNNRDRTYTFLGGVSITAASGMTGVKIAATVARADAAPVPTSNYKAR